MQETIEFCGLRHFGPDTPIAVIRFGLHSRFYDLQGVRDLMAMYAHRDEFAIFARIEREMLVPGSYPDIQEEDFSGQEKLF